MFGLTFAEKAKSTIKSASDKCLYAYRQVLREKTRANLPITDDQEARRQYRLAVTRKVEGMLSGATPRFMERYQRALKDPSLLGLQSLDAKNGFKAGELYALTYFSFTEKKPKLKHCDEMDRMQESLLKEAFSSLTSSGSSPAKASDSGDPA